MHQRVQCVCLLNCNRLILGLQYTRWQKISWIKFTLKKKFIFKILLNIQEKKNLRPHWYRLFYLYNNDLSAKYNFCIICWSHDAMSAPSGVQISKFDWISKIELIPGCGYNIMVIIGINQTDIKKVNIPTNRKVTVTRTRPIPNVWKGIVANKINSIVIWLYKLYKSSSDSSCSNINRGESLRWPTKRQDCKMNTTNVMDRS